MVSAWRNFKNIFSRPLFTIIFRPEMLKFHAYSILTGDTMVGFVIFCVLSQDHLFYFCLCIAYIFDINTQNMTNPTIVSPVKMEYGWNFSISGLKMMVKSGLEKIFLKFLHALTMSFLLLNLYFWPKLLHSMR